MTKVDDNLPELCYGFATVRCCFAGKISIQRWIDGKKRRREMEGGRMFIYLGVAGTVVHNKP